MPDSLLTKEQQDNLRKICDEVTSVARPSLVPIIKKQNDVSFEVIASALYLEFAGIKYLVSASHAIEEDSKETYYFPGKSGLEILTGAFVRMNSNDKDDKHDLIVFRIGSGIAEKFKIFVPYILSTEPENYDDTGNKEMCGYFGYPNTKNKDIRIFPCKFKITSYVDYIVDGAEYLKAGYNPSLHIVIPFTPKKSTDTAGQIKRCPKLIGMSGGSVWSIYNRENPKNPRVKGIVMETSLDQKYLIGVRINCVKECIRGFTDSK